MPEPQVVGAEIIVYRLFDFASAADLVRAEEIWRLHTGVGSARRTLRATSPKAISYDVPAPPPAAAPGAAYSRTARCLFR